MPNETITPVRQLVVLHSGQERLAFQHLRGEAVEPPTSGWCSWRIALPREVLAGSTPAWIRRPQFVVAQFLS